MCLDTNRKVVFRAKEDITVVKILNKDNTSPYKYFGYQPGMHYTLDEALEAKKSVFYYSEGRYYVERGYHAFVLSEVEISRSCSDIVVIPVRKSNNSWSFFDSKIVVMTVPKGARYYLGVNGDIASDQLVTGSLKGISIDTFNALRKA